MLTLQHITKSYFSGNDEIKILDDISITFPQKGLIGIYGKSGCGKSTFLNIISSLEKPDQGDIFFYNKKLTETFLRDEIAFVYQNHDLIPALNVKENIKLALKTSHQSFHQQKFNMIIKRLEIERLLSHYPSQLSLGQSRRVSIARALLKNTSIILADEPTGALHLQQAREVMELLKEASLKRLVIIVSHDQKLLKEYCDSLLTVENCKIKGKIKKQTEKRREQSYHKKSYLFMYIIQQMKAQKYKLLFLFMFQIILILSSFFIITALQGVNEQIVLTKKRTPLKNIMTIENYNSQEFKKLPQIHNAYYDYQSLLDLGTLSCDAMMEYLPQYNRHIVLKEGRMPIEYNEVLITSSLKDKISDHKLVYKTETKEFELNVVGVIEEDFFKEKYVYFPYIFRNVILDYINHYVIVIESENCLKLSQQLEKDYLVTYENGEKIQNYTELLSYGQIIAIIFIAVSLMSSMFLLYIVYTIIIDERKHDCSLLVMMGVSLNRLLGLFIKEAFFIGTSIGICGVILCQIIFYYCNHVLTIQNYLSFSLKLEKYMFFNEDIYLMIIFIYILLTVLFAYISIKRVLHLDFVSLLREE